MPVMRTLFTEKSRVPVKIWTAEVEESALKQLENLSQLPFIYKHIAVAPDCHAGIGSTEGIDEFKDGFWLNLDLQFTKGSDTRARYWVPPHKIRYIARDFITSEA